MNRTIGILPVAIGWKPMPRDAVGWKPMPRSFIGWNATRSGPIGWKPMPRSS